MDSEKDLARFLKCLGEPTRLKLLGLLAGGEMSVGELADGLGRDQPLVSHHLRSLEECGIVLGRKEEQKVYYRITDPRLGALLDSGRALVEDNSFCQRKKE